MLKRNLRLFWFSLIKDEDECFYTLPGWLSSSFPLRSHRMHFQSRSLTNIGCLAGFMRSRVYPKHSRSREKSMSACWKVYYTVFHCILFFLEFIESILGQIKWALWLIKWLSPHGSTLFFLWKFTGFSMTFPHLTSCYLHLFCVNDVDYLLSSTIIYTLLIFSRAEWMATSRRLLRHLGLEWPRFTVVGTVLLDLHWWHACNTTAYSRWWWLHVAGIVYRKDWLESPKPRWELLPRVVAPMRSTPDIPEGIPMRWGDPCNWVAYEGWHVALSCGFGPSSLCCASGAGRVVQVYGLGPPPVLVLCPGPNWDPAWSSGCCQWLVPSVTGPKIASGAPVNANALPNNTHYSHPLLSLSVLLCFTVGIL